MAATRDRIPSNKLSQIDKERSASTTNKPKELSNSWKGDDNTPKTNSTLKVLVFHPCADIMNVAPPSVLSIELSHLDYTALGKSGLLFS